MKHLAKVKNKIGQYILVIFVTLTINFALPRLAPGDPLLYFFGETTINELTAEQKQ